MKKNWFAYTLIKYVSIQFLAFLTFFWRDKSLTLCGISEANFVLDQLEDLICSCAGIKLYLLYLFFLLPIHWNRIDTSINTILGVFWHFLARQITYLVRNLWGQFWPWPTWGPHLQLRWDQTLWRGIGHPWSGIEHRWAFGWSYTRSLVWRVAIVFALFQVSCENTKSKNTVCFIRNHSKHTMNQINKSIFKGKTNISYFFVSFKVSCENTKNKDQHPKTIALSCRV